MGSSLSTVAEQAYSSIVSWRALAIVLLLTNLKAIPGAWTIRVWYRLISSFRAETKKMSPNETGTKMLATVRKVHPEDPISNHPLFIPATMTSHSPLLEIDYNLHKSNSTYFTDLDVSRSKLMGGILAPVWPMSDMRLEVRTDPKDPNSPVKLEKVKGRAAVILGAVHTSFRKEIKAYAAYRVQSRVLSWDNRWIYIGTWFLAPKGKGGKPEVLASSLSKYILKKGRITVRPELAFTQAGLIPSKSDPESSDSKTTVSGSAKSTGQEASAFDNAAEVTQRAAKKVADASTATSAETGSAEPGIIKVWSYEEIEQERFRGMELVRNWAVLDGELEGEWYNDWDRRK